jgi:hypothetical protein
MSAPRPPGGISDATWLFVRALLPLGVLALVGGIAFLLSPSGRALTGRVSEAADMFGRFARAGLEAKGPGISSLRELGCLQAGAIEARNLNDVAGLLGNDAMRLDLPADGRFVFCKLRRGADALDCEVAARAYAQAARYSREFWILVYRPDPKHSCRGRFDPGRAAFSDEELPTVKDTP